MSSFEFFSRKSPGKSITQKPEQIAEEDESYLTEPLCSLEEADALYGGHSLATHSEPKSKWNFYGRFRPETKNCTPINKDNYLDALTASTIDSITEPSNENSSKVYLNFLSGAIDEELLQRGKIRHDIKRLKPENLYRAFALAYARILCLASIDGKFEDASQELDLLDNFLEQQFQRNKSHSRDASFIALLKGQLERSKRWLDQEKRNFPERLPNMPNSADEFFIYNHKLGKAKQIPDFKVLLGEKIRWLLANDLHHSMENISLNDVETTNKKHRLLIARSGPSFHRMRGLTNLYLHELGLYAAVESIDVPIYWEVKSELEEFDSKRNVVFGRDGRYLYTALKAADFGLNENKLAYVIITSPMREDVKFYASTTKDAAELKDRILKYLNQNGVTLDFSFIDTGYAGSIPEFVINILADAGGVTLPHNEIDARIKLISSDDPHARRQLTRRQDNSLVSTIENRPKDIERPENLFIDKHGIIKPLSRPTSIMDQLSAWVVEHAVFRNFAPKLDPEKRIRYTKENPLKGYKFFTEFYSDNISTHPKELWIDDKGHKILLKGGPSHTVQADFVGYKFLEAIGVGIPYGVELVHIDGGTKLKMEFLEDWKGAGIHLPNERANDATIQKALLVDALLGNYDRTPWNILLKPGETNAVFIDNGAGLFSRARGGYKGFPCYFDVEQLKEILSNPQFIGQPVNEAYNNFIQVKDGKVIVKNKPLLLEALNKLRDLTTEDFINSVINQAGFLNGSKSIEDLENRIKALTDELSRLRPDSADCQKTSQAIATYKDAIRAGGEASYLKMALTIRRQSILILLSPFTPSTW